MSGAMSNIQYMPSPHGLSKRIRLHHAEFYTNSFQNIAPETANEPDNLELVTSSHFWVKKCHLKGERIAVNLACGVDGFIEKFKEFSTDGYSVLQGVKETTLSHIIARNLVREGDTETSNKTRSKTSTGTKSKDTVVQTINFSEADSEDLISKETVKPFLNSTESDLLNSPFKAANISTMVLMDTEEKYASISNVSDIHSSATSNTDPTCEVKTIPDFPNATGGDAKKSNKNNQSCAFIDVCDSNKFNENEQGTLDDSEKFHYESELQNRIFPCSKYASESCVSLEGEQDSINRVGQISQMRDITIEPVEKCVESKSDQTRGNKLKKCSRRQIHRLGCMVESNSKLKKIGIGQGLYKSYQCKCVVKTPNVLKHYVPETRVLSRKTYTKIAKRLPDYKLFANAIQKAMRNVKRSKNYNKSISPEIKKQSNIAKDNIIEKSRLTTLLQDMNVMDVFLDYIGNKISKMISLVHTTSRDVALLDAESEDISVALYHIRNTQFLAELDGADNAKLVARTRSEIQELGDLLLQKIASLRLDWVDILTAYQTNLVLLARSVYVLCSVPIETKLVDDPDLVYTVAHEVKDKIKDVEVKEVELDLKRSCNYKELSELESDISNFHEMDNLLDDLCPKQM